MDRNTGNVLFGADDAKVLTRFVNTSLDRFAASLRAMIPRYRRIPGLSDPEIDEIVADIEATLRRIDPAALQGPDHWWMALIEQMYDGLL